MRDVVERPYNFFGLFELHDPEEATGLFITLAMFGALFSALIGGLISDKVGHKQCVLISSFIMTFVPWTMSFNHGYSLVVMLGAFYGLGYGSYVRYSILV
jgi:MFS family permease